jgi:hypothetical protein
MSYVLTFQLYGLKKLICMDSLNVKYFINFNYGDTYFEDVTLLCECSFVFAINDIIIDKI